MDQTQTVYELERTLEIEYGIPSRWVMNGDKAVYVGGFLPAKEYGVIVKEHLEELRFEMRLELGRKENVGR